jgi:hypothetical protein
LDLDPKSSRARTLLVFTDSFPYGAALEDTFLGPELEHLQRAFSSVVIVPSRRGGPRAVLPDAVDVDESLADVFARIARPMLALRGSMSRLTWGDLRARPNLALSPRGLARLIHRAARAELTEAWAVRYLAARGLRPQDCVAYSFWCDHVPTGLGLLKLRAPGMTVVSRAHGADLYAERHRPPYLPCRPFTLAGLDRLFPDSARGVAYMSERYPSFAPRCEVARMGVSDPGFRTASSADGGFRVVSCSVLIPLKRVDLIMGAVAEAARRRPDVAFEWHHFGDGEPRLEMIRQVEAMFPSNASAHLPGYPGISGLMAFYRTTPVDVFVNASVSEGTPVSIMEAISCGIPVVATAVGGNVEIVSEENGWLVDPTPTAEEIASAFIAAIDDKETLARKRAGSRRVWAERYDASSNYTAFAARLVELSSEG